MERIQQENVAWIVTEDGSVIIGYGPFTDSAIQPIGKLAFYIQSFDFSEPRPWKTPSSYEQIDIATFRQRVAHFKHLPEIHWQPVESVGFSEVFQEINQHILNGSFEKTVPVVTEHGTSEASPYEGVISSLSKINLPLHAYGWVESHRGFAGASPELLFSLTDRQCRTMALAGTARVEDQAIFAVDEKEIREHQYVAQSLVSKLHDLGNVTRHPRRILALRSIVHFLTEIEVELDQDQSPEFILKRLHPTPALGPLPRTSTNMESLIKWRRRLQCPNHFGAPFGIQLPNGHFEAWVTIRGLWWENQQIHLPTGCGIIEASRLLNEWRELRLKRDSVKQLFNIPFSQSPD